MSLIHKFTPVTVSGASVAITGGARGIGLATARAFLAQGASVSIGDLDVDEAKAAVADLGPGVQACALDVGSEESFMAFLSAAEAFSGPLDILVNNAGIMPLGNFLDEPRTVSETQIAVNLWGPMNGMRQVLPGMVDRGCGHVVNVASLAGRTPTPGAAVYSATKHAVIGLSLSIRDEVALHGVSVSTVLPSLVRTDLGAGLKMPAAVTVDPSDIAEAIVDTVRTRRAMTVVPGWLGAAIGAMNALPVSVQEAARKASRATEVGSNALASGSRAAYLDRIGRQVEEA